MNEVIVSRLSKLRNEMAKSNADWYLITSEDFHGSEYVADYFKVREYYTGFTGDNATLVLNKDKAYMWTDGRFFIQADIELKGTGVELMKMGEEGVPTVSQFLTDNVKNGEVLMADGRSMNTGVGKNIEKAVNKSGATFVYNNDIAGSLMEGRANMPESKIFILGDDVSGESMTAKIDRVRKKMVENGCKAYFLAKLDDIMWLTNLRAGDITCNPVALSYFFLTESESVLFLQNSKVTDEVKKYLEGNGVQIKDYDTILEYLENRKYEGKVLLDESGVNFASYKTISKNAEVVNAMNPTTRMKAVKNATELKRLKEAYIQDSLAVIRFQKWLSENIGKIDIDELSAAAFIDNERTKLPGYFDLSFPTICGYNANGAMMHYSATPENYAKVKPEGLLLVDSGGQYMTGTTDVTRTQACGPVSDKMKLHFTKVAVGMLALADAKFLYGCTGRNLDILSRLPLWEMGIDYKCGTGHGVGYILNVHEGPHNIRWQYRRDIEEAVLEEGMIMSDEPGVYIEGEYGIRTENVILCKKGPKTGDGQFMCFEHLTFAPIDLNLIDTKYMSQKDVERLNSYHKDVYEKCAPFLSEDECIWLKNATRPIEKIS